VKSGSPVPVYGEHLVWVGRAANYAAKLSELSGEHASWITEAVYLRLDDASKFGKDENPMWEARIWSDMNNMRVYRSNWQWSL
jgi:class 3 adenylate cyclase